MDIATVTTDPFNITTDGHRALKHVIIPTYTLILSLISGVLSIVGAFIIFYTYVQLEEIRTPTRKLLLCLTVADLITCIGYLAGTLRHALIANHWPKSAGAFCKILSFVTTFSSLASFLWTTVIAIYMFSAISFNATWMYSRRLVTAYHIVCWGIPGLICIAGAGFNVFGEDRSVFTTSRCWIRASLENRIQIFWMTLTAQGWEILCYFIIASLYILHKIHTCLQRRRYITLYNRHGLLNFQHDDDTYFLCLCNGLYCLRVWGTARFFMAVVQQHVDSFRLTRAQTVLFNLQGIGDNGQAFWNCVLFCFFHKTVRRFLFRCRNDHHVDVDRVNEVQ